MAKSFHRSPDLDGIYYALALLVVVITVGVLGYMFIEGYSLLDALYMVVITLATVGFKEVQPLSDPGKYFTILLIISSFGSFGYVITLSTRFLIDGGFRNYYKLKKVEKIIKRADNHVIVCGYGRNGSQACRELQKHNQPFLVIELNESVIRRIVEDEIGLYIHGDSTMDEVLERAGIQRAKALITTLPNDADNTFVVLTARNLNPSLTIISRASGNYSDRKLKRAGATNIIMPDKLGGIHMAKLVVQPDIIEFIDNMILQDGRKVALEEIPGIEIRKDLLGSTIGDLQVRSHSGATIIGLKTSVGEYIYNPSPDHILAADDKIFVLGKPDQISLLRKEIKS